MKPIKKDLQSVVKGLKTLLKKTERIERRLDKAPVTRIRRGSSPIVEGAKPGKSGEDTAMAAVYRVIQKSRRGATTTQITDKTGYDSKKIWNAVNRLKARKKIKSARRGVYVPMN